MALLVCRMAANLHLQRSDESCGGDHRVLCAVRQTGVAASTVHGDVEAVRRRHDRADLHHQLKYTGSMDMIDGVIRKVVTRAHSCQNPIILVEAKQ